MDATQQWQSTAMLGMDTGMQQQCEPQMTLWTVATAQQHPHPGSQPMGIMVPVTQEANFQMGSVLVHGGAHMATSGFACNAGMSGWSMGACMQSMPCTQPAAATPQIIGFMPIYSADLPVVQPAMPHQDAVWQRVQPFPPLNFEAPQPPVATMPFSDAADCHPAPSTHSAESSPPETYYLSTPELTPRYCPEATPEPESAPCLSLQLSLQVGLQPCILKDVATQLAELPDQHVVQDRVEPESSDDEFELPEGNPADEIVSGEWLRCWDMIPRDSLSYASSETSTTVSRSARRRRGRRSAKAKASRSSMPILESPPSDDLLVVEEKKIELMQMLELGGDKMHTAVLSLRGSVFRMSMEPLGCRVVQRAFEVASTAERETLVSELHGHVRLAIASPHANFVLQKVIEVLPVHSASFVASELVTVAAEVARHRFGCRVLSRLIEHHLCGRSTSSSTNNLIDELLLEADQLINHNFARHVLELILEHGNDCQKQKIADMIKTNLFLYAKNRNASYVVEKALALCNAEHTHAIASELLTDPQCFLMLAVHECGTHVVKAVMQSHADCAERANKLLLADADRVKSSKYGKRLLDEM